MPRDELSRDLDDQNATVAAARAAQAREDWAEAARLWIAYCDRFSDDPGGFISAAEMLQKLSRGDEADEILARGVRLHPSNVPLRAAHARIAERGADWAQAAARWQSNLSKTLTLTSDTGTTLHHA
jgi:hypothetical protein